MMAQYRTLVEFPGIPAGELTEFDGTVNEPVGVYRLINYPGAWLDAAVVERNPTMFELVA